MSFKRAACLVFSCFFVSSAVSAQDWSGGYFGGQLGYADFDEVLNAGGDRFTLEDMSFGLHLGYRFASGTLVYGTEVDADFIGGELDFNGTPAGIDFEKILRVKGSVGFDAGTVLPYATLGYAWADTSSGSNDYDGVVYGLGLSWQTSSTFMLGFELLEHNLNTSGGVDAELTTANVRASFKF
jgi:hypothetical protein